MDFLESIPRVLKRLQIRTLITLTGLASLSYNIVSILFRYIHIFTFAVRLCKNIQYSQGIPRIKHLHHPFIHNKLFKIILLL